MFKSESIFLNDAIIQGVIPELDFFPAPDQGQIVRIVFPEFTCVCPKTGYPDFAVITIWYQPGQTCVELKSWKLFLNSFRMVGCFHESFIAYLYGKVMSELHPAWLMIAGDFSPRGNVDTTVIRESNSQGRPDGFDIVQMLKPRCHETF